MTISSTNRKAGPYAGNDVAVSFPFAFKVFAASDLYVVRADSDGAETVLALTANYTVTLNSDQNANPGGTITLPAALADGLTLTITSTLPYLQPVDLTNNGGFYPKVINSALDRLTIFVQQIASEIGASLKLGSNDAPGSGAYRAGGNRISDVGNPTSPGDAVNRGWLDLAITGVNTYTNSLYSQARSYAESLVSGVVGGYGYFVQLGAGAISRAFQDKMRESVSVLDFGASPSASAATNDAAFAAVLTSNLNYCEIDLCGFTYNITQPVVIGSSTFLTLKNGGLKQLTETANILECGGTYHSNLSLKNIVLEHAFNTASSGSCFVVNATVTNFNFFNWSGGRTINGLHGVRTNGSVWMAHFEHIWVLSPRSSGWYMPASGSVVDNTLQLGGSTTTKLYKCFVTDVQNAEAAYMIGSGYDTLILEQCSADRCYRFGDFKASPFRIINCSSENVVNPPTGVVAGPHRFISVGSGSGLTFDGFHVAFDAGFVSPAPGGGNVNSFLYSINPVHLSLSGLRGNLPSGYYSLNQSGGYSVTNTTLLGNGVRTISGGISRDMRMIPPSARPNRTNLAGVTAGTGATTLWSFEAGDNTYILTMSWSYSGQTTNSTWLVYTSSGQARGTVFKLMSGPDYPTNVVITISGTTVVCTVSGANLAHTWKAFNLTLSDY